MKKLNRISKFCVLVLGMFTISLLLFSCEPDNIDNEMTDDATTEQTDDDSDPDGDNNDGNNNDDDSDDDGDGDGNGDGDGDGDNDNEDTSATELSPIDITFLTQVKQASDIYDMNQIWSGYDFSSRPMYYVYVDANNTPLRGYLVNPIAEYAGATKIEGAEALGLNLYRFDQDITAAIEKLNQGNGEFDFDYNIEGNNHYLQRYSDASVADALNPTITIAVHEIFHIYQFSDWVFTPNIVQDEDNYPITKELLEMQILMAHIGKKMPAETDVATVREYLKMYVAIRSNEIALDTSSEQFVKNMANEQEKGEGIARYIDNLLGAEIIPNFEITFSSPESYNNMTSAEEVRGEFAFGIWYGTGAAATHMLKNQGITIENEIKNGKTLFDVAEENLNMTAAEKEAALQQAKDEFDWAAIQELAERLANL